MKAACQESGPIAHPMPRYQHERAGDFLSAGEMANLLDAAKAGRLVPSGALPPTS
jgi:hypothetical protein